MRFAGREDLLVCGDHGLPEQDFRQRLPFRDGSVHELGTGAVGDNDALTGHRLERLQGELAEGGKVAAFQLVGKHLRRRRDGV